MIKSSKHYIKDANDGKIAMLESMFELSKKVVKHYIDLILSGNLPLKNNLSSKVLPSVYGLDGGQWKQLLYKHASSIIRSNEKKIKDRVYKKYKKVYSYFSKNKRQTKFLSFKFKDLYINHKKRMKFDLKHFSLEIDERMCDLECGNSFDWFLNIKLPFIKEGTKRNRLSVNIPIKEHKHSLKFKQWDRKKTVRLSKDDKNRFYFSFCYEKEKAEISGDKVIGLDIGYKKLIADSDGNFYGSHLENFYIGIARKKRGSKNYKRAVIHKNNEINRVLNAIDFDNVCDVVVEDLKNVKHKSKLSSKFNNKLQYWTYSSVLKKLDSTANEKGFFISRVNPAYTSQTCSNCGECDKTNRKGEVYSCSACGMIKDADHNASINILHKGVYSPHDKQTQFLDYS